MDKPKPPLPSPSLPHAINAKSRPLENLKSLLIKCAKQRLAPHHKDFVEKRLNEFFPDNIRTPDHPPYAWMIENAITQLNEEGGSTEESISNFILKEYKDLPFAHTALLNHHLKKLSETDDLVRNRNGCHSIAKSRAHPNPRFTDDTKSLVPVLSSTPSSVTEPSCSSYESTSTCSSGECFSLRKGIKLTKRRKTKRNMSRNKKGIKINTKHNTGRGRGRSQARGRGCGRGSGSGRSKPEDMMMEVYNVDLTVAKEGVESRVRESVMMTEPEPIGHANKIDLKRVEPLKKENLVSGKNNSMATSSISSSRREKVISGQRSKNDWPQKRTVGSVRAPRTGIRRGRPRNKKDMQIVEYRKNVELVEVSEVGAKEENVEESRLQEDLCNFSGTEICPIDDDNMTNMKEGELIDEVYMELKLAADVRNNPTLEICQRSKGERSEPIEIQYIAQGMQSELSQEIHEITNSEIVQWGSHVDGNVTNDTHVEVDVFHGVNESAGKNEITLVLQKPRSQESNKIEERVQPRGVETEIIGQAHVCEGDHLQIEEKDEKHVKNKFQDGDDEFGHCDGLNNYEGQFGLSALEECVETRCLKPRPRPLNNESNKVANRDGPLAAKHVLHKQGRTN